MKTIWKKAMAPIVWFFIISAVLSGSVQIPYASAEDMAKCEAVAEYRVDRGVFYSKTYHPESDSYSMTILTSDGNEWEVDDYIHKLYEPLVVEFDTNGTEEITDDKITRIIINSAFS
jgi:hypothetical protein